MALALMNSTAGTSALSFKSRMGSTTPFRPVQTLATRNAPVSITAKGPSLKPKNNLAKVKYDSGEKQVSPVESAFTRRREIFVGRTAMTGFVSAVVGELLTGRGALGQLQLETRLPQPVINWLVIGIVAFNVVTALNPAGSTFDDDNQADVNKRPRGAVQNPNINAFNNPQGFLGTSSGFGFTKKNELFVGRVAMLGFASELIGEQLTGGKGPLGQIGAPLNLPLNPELAGFGLAVWIGFFLVAAVGYGNWGQQEGNEEIY